MPHANWLKRFLSVLLPWKAKPAASPPTDPALEIAVDLIAEEEGFVANVYLDVAGNPTIGYGFTYHDSGLPVTTSDPPMTEADARIRLRALVSKILYNVRSMVAVPISHNQEAALTSFAYNLGVNALRNSTLLRLLNSGDVQGAADEFGKWNKAGGRVWAGLKARRARERRLFLKPD